MNSEIEPRRRRTVARAQAKAASCGIVTDAMIPSAETAEFAERRTAAESAPRMQTIESEL
jgi:hypothetical protein